MIPAESGLPEPRVPQPRSVRRAMEAMQADLGRRWTLADLADVAGASARTLQRQFLACFGKSPQAVLRDIGFARARRELLQGGPDGTVMDIAARCGFAHHGRFAVAYRARFGETPSQTIRRRSVLAGQLATGLTAVLRAQDRPTLAFDRIDADAAHRRDRRRYRRRSHRRADTIGACGHVTA